MEAGKSIAEIFKIAANSKNKVLTLTFLRKGSQVLLGMKNRGFGQVRGVMGRVHAETF